MEDELKILILEDVPTDAELMERELCKSGVTFSAKRVDTREDFSREVEDFSPDLILADYNLPSFDGLSALAIARERCPDVPFIFVSGAIGEELAVETLRKGATDYVLKDSLFRLVPVVRRALQEVEEQKQRKRIELALRLSEEKYRTMVEQSNDMIWTLDIEGNFTFFNKRYEEISGYRLEDLRDKAFTQLVLEEYVPWVIEALRRVVNREPQHYEVGVIKKDGGILILSVNTAPIFIDYQFVGTVSFGRDVTKQKRMEEELRMKAELLDAATDSIMVHDLEGNLVYVNEAVFKFLGYNKDELMRMNLHTLYTPEYARLIESRIEQLMEIGEATFESEIFRKDKSTAPIEVHARIIELGSRKLVLSISRDITKHKQREEDLRNNMERLRKTLSRATR